MARKIIQIAVAHAPRDEMPEHLAQESRYSVVLAPHDLLFALCDDGTVWLHHWPGDADNEPGVEYWEQLAGIPQD